MFSPSPSPSSKPVIFQGVNWPIQTQSLPNPACLPSAAASTSCKVRFKPPKRRRAPPNSWAWEAKLGSWKGQGFGPVIDPWNEQFSPLKINCLSRCIFFWGKRPIFRCEHVSLRESTCPVEPQEKMPYFPFCWLFNRDPYNGLFLSLYKWVV